MRWSNRTALIWSGEIKTIACRLAAKYPEHTLAVMIFSAPSAVADNVATGTLLCLAGLIAISSWLRNQPEIYWRGLLESV
jgi:hypothetical protein